MEDELLLNEAARLYALARQAGDKSRRLYREVAGHLCRVAAQLRADRQYPEGHGRKNR